MKGISYNENVFVSNSKKEETQSINNDRENNQVQQKKYIQNFSRLSSKSFIQILPIILTYCLSQFYFGYTVVFLGALNIKHIILYYGIDLNQSFTQGFANGSISLGASLGCILSNKFNKSFSRKNSVLITNLIVLIAGGLIYVPNQIIFFIIRTIQGICIGLYSSLIPNYINQLSPINFKGTFGAFVQVSLSIGTVFAFLFTYLLTQITNDVDKQYIWFYVFGLTQITTLIQTLLILFIYPLDTPKYLILKGLKQQTIQLLKYFYKMDYIETVYNSLYEDIIGNNKQKKSQQSINQSLQRLLFYQNQFEFKNIRKSPKIAIFIAFYMSLSQQMYGMGAVIIYGEQTMRQSFPDIKNLIGLIINSPLIIASLILSCFISKYSSKNILQIGTLSLGIMNFVIGIGFLTQSKSTKSIEFSSYLILIGEISYNIIYGISAGAIFWVYMPAIIQPQIIPYATFVNWISSALVLILFPVLIDYVPDKNPGYLFIFFGIYTFICFCVYFKFVIEIKDKTQTQIHQQYNNLKINCFDSQK